MLALLTGIVVGVPLTFLVYYFSPFSESESGRIGAAILVTAVYFFYRLYRDKLRPSVEN